MTVTSMPPKATTSGKPDQAGAPGEEKKGGRKKFVVVVLLLVMIAVGWWFFLKPDAPQEPVAGEVKTLESVQLNLAGGHYLRLGLALQLAEDGGDVEGAKALDAAISLFSGLEMADVARGEQREKLRVELMEELEKRYEGAVLEVYFTEFVTQ